MVDGKTSTAAAAGRERKEAHVSLSLCVHLDLESETQSTCAKENSKENRVYEVSVVKRITSLSGENNMAQQESSSRNMLFAHSYTSLGFLVVVVVSSIHFLDILREREGEGRSNVLIRIFLLPVDQDFHALCEQKQCLNKSCLSLALWK